MYFLPTLLLLASIVTPGFSHTDGTPLIARYDHEVFVTRSLSTCGSNLHKRAVHVSRAEKLKNLILRHTEANDPSTEYPSTDNSTDNSSNTTGSYNHKAAVASAAAAALAAAPVSCLLAPELVLGPFFIPETGSRYNLRESQPGIPLLLDMRIVDVNTCQPVSGAWVDIWHANATGSYSGIRSLDTEGERWGRGVVQSDSYGIVQVETLFPGWYEGRATHVHIAVHHAPTADRKDGMGRVSHVGQVFFEEEALQTVDAMGVYNGDQGGSGGTTRVLNADDRFFAEGNATQYNAVAKMRMIDENVGPKAGWVAVITVGVDLRKDFSKTVEEQAYHK